MTKALKLYFVPRSLPAKEQARGNNNLRVFIRWSNNNVAQNFSSACKPFCRSKDLRYVTEKGPGFEGTEAGRPGCLEAIKNAFSCNGRQHPSFPASKHHSLLSAII